MKYTTANIFFEPQIEVLDETDKFQICTPEHIQSALQLVTEWFRDKTDKFGKPVMLHSIAVGLMGRTNDLTVVGLLHDLLEDTDIPESTLYEKFPRQIVNTVKLLTRDSSIPYMKYVRSIAESGDKLAIEVKLNDLRHNMMRAGADDMYSLTTRYEQAFKILSDV